MIINRNTSATVALVAAGFSCVSFMFGCSGTPDRPPPSSVDTTTSIATPNATPVGNHDPCQAGTWRECRMHYVDADGQAQCPMDVELCREDGTGYYDCGTWVNGADGSPVSRSEVQQATKK